jgi:hypothetical protein
MLASQRSAASRFARASGKARSGNARHAVVVTAFSSPRFRGEGTNMTHPTDDYKDAPSADSLEGDAPQYAPAEPVEQEAAPAVAPLAAPVAAAIPPAHEQPAPQEQAFVEASYGASAEETLGESFSIEPHDKPDDLQAMYAANTEAYDTVSQALRSSLEEIAAGVSQFNWKLIEFGRANAQSNMAFVQNVAGVRSVRDAVDVQTAFLREQYDAAAGQLRELQALSTDIAEKAAAPFKQQFMRQTQIFRIC